MRLARAMSPAWTSARMWLEETISPSTSTSGTTRVWKRLIGRQRSGVARGPVPEAKVLADDDVRRLQALYEHVVDELLRALLCEALIERDHDEVLDAELGDQLALGLEVVSSRGAASGRTTGAGGARMSARCREPRITSRCPRWTPSNSPTATFLGRGAPR